MEEPEEEEPEEKEHEEEAARPVFVPNVRPVRERAPVARVVGPRGERINF
jgi:hypothetical protein